MMNKYTNEFQEAVMSFFRNDDDCVSKLSVEDRQEIVLACLGYSDALTRMVEAGFELDNK